MNPKEKAKELSKKYADLAHRLSEDTDWKYGVECAIMCVDELIKNATWKDESYYKKVKQELEKL